MPLKLVETNLNSTFKRIWSFCVSFVSMMTQIHKERSYRHCLFSWLNTTGDHPFTETFQSQAWCHKLQFTWTGDLRRSLPRLKKIKFPHPGLFFISSEWGRLFSVRSLVRRSHQSLPGHASNHERIGQPPLGWVYSAGQMKPFLAEANAIS